MSQAIGIIYNKETKEGQQLALKVGEAFSAKNAKTDIFTSDNFHSNINLAFVIGGDGSILKAARYYSEYDIPVLGMNLGRLGFLSQTNSNETDLIIDNILSKNYIVQERSMLYEERTKMSAVNDIVIKSGEAGRTSKFQLFINDKFLCEYLADGIIISTPTGSSAYNLSAGGPVINPKLDVFVITAICPHSLSARPLGIPTDEIVSVRACDSEESFNVISDGQTTKKIAYNEITIVKKHTKTAKLVIMNKENNDFYSILRNKLYWGIAPSCWNYDKKSHN